MGFDPFNKEPGVYITEAASPPPPPSGVPKSTGAMFGVTKWGPVGEAVFVISFAEWVRLFGEFISDVYPAHTQVKKYFQNGGVRLYFTRITHYTDITDPDTVAALAAIGYVFDDAETDAEIATSAADGGNGGDEGAGTSGGTYTGATDGIYTVEVTTGGAYGGTAEVTITSDVVGDTGPTTVNPADDVAFAVGTKGVTLKLSDGGDTSLTAGDIWTVAVTAQAYVTNDRRIKCTAKYPGLVGNGLTIALSAGTNGVAGEFALTVYLDGDIAEVKWDNLSLTIGATNYFLTVINNKNSGSEFIIVEDLKDTNSDPVGLTQNDVPFSGGDNGLTSLVDADYIGDAVAQTGIQAFSILEFPLIISCPDEDVKATVLVRKEIARFVNNDHKLSFALLIVPRSLSPAAALTFQNNTLATDCERAALYYQWGIDEVDGKVVSTIGAMMGVYARFANNKNKGIWWSPAGTTATLLGFSGLDKKVGPTNAGMLNENRINVFKIVIGVGIICNGSRTMAIARAADFKYIGARLNTSDIESRLLKNTRWASQRPHGSRLYKDISTVVKAILNRRFKEGGFDGDSIAEAYKFLCNSTNNTQVEKNAGIVKVAVGIKNLQTAEFIWFNISQLASGGTLSEG